MEQCPNTLDNGSISTLGNSVMLWSVVNREFRDSPFGFKVSDEFGC
jgi:hypothetical protein